MSLATEMALVSVFALAAAIVFYIILSITADAALNKIFDTEQFYRKCDQKTIESLEKYVRENDIKSDDWYMLNRWIKDGNAIMLSVYKDDVLVYDSQMQSSYSEDTETDEDSSSSVSSAVMIENDYAMQTSYKIDFFTLPTSTHKESFKLYFFFSSSVI